MLCVALTTAYAEEETIDIAAIYALTGVAAQANTSTLQGIRYAVKEINAQGGILGKPIRLLIFDNFSTPIGSNFAAKQAVLAHVSAIVGASWSSHSLAIAKVAQEEGIPMITSYSTHPGVTKYGNYIFRVCFTDDFQGKVMAGFARNDLGAETAMIFTDLTSDYSLKLSEIFRRHFTTSGGKVVSEIEYKLTQYSFEEESRKASDREADVLFLSGHDESGILIKCLQEAGVSGVPIGGDGWDQESFLTKGGHVLRLGYHCSHWSREMAPASSRQFAKHYGDSPNFDAGMALGYDAIMVLADAIARAGSTERHTIRTALAETHGFEGVTGTITFDAQGDPLKPAVIMKIENGVRSYLKTFTP